MCVLLRPAWVDKNVPGAYRLPTRAAHGLLEPRLLREVTMCTCSWVAQSRKHTLSSAGIWSKVQRLECGRRAVEGRSVSCANMSNIFIRVRHKRNRLGIKASKLTGQTIQDLRHFNSCYVLPTERLSPAYCYGEPHVYKLILSLSACARHMVLS